MRARDCRTYFLSLPQCWHNPCNPGRPLSRLCRRLGFFCCFQGQDHHKACALIRALGGKEAIRVTDLQSTQRSLATSHLVDRETKALTGCFPDLVLLLVEVNLEGWVPGSVSNFLMGSLPLSFHRIFWTCSLVRWLVKCLP